MCQQAAGIQEIEKAAAALAENANRTAESLRAFTGAAEGLWRSSEKLSEEIEQLGDSA